MLTRRGLLGMFAAGIGAAVLPSGVIMPVRKIITPRFTDADLLGIINQGNRALQASVNRQWAAALHATVMREGVLVRVTEHFRGGSQVEPGDRFILPLLPGDKVLAAGVDLAEVVSAMPIMGDQPIGAPQPTLRYRSMPLEHDGVGSIFTVQGAKLDSRRRRG